MNMTVVPPCCGLAPSSRLILEVEGGEHAEGGWERSRDAHLTAQGDHILRLSNPDVMTKLPGVPTRLAQEVTR